MSKLVAVLSEMIIINSAASLHSYLRVDRSPLKIAGAARDQVFGYRQFFGQGDGFAI